MLDKYSPSGGSANPERGLRMYDMLQATFDSMPLAHVVSSGEKRVFVVHGGMMQKHGVRLEHVAAIQRKREIPFGFPGFEDKLFEDLMWSDPRPHNGHAPSDRGAGESCMHIRARTHTHTRKRAHIYTYAPCICLLRDARFSFLMHAMLFLAASPLMSPSS